MLADCHSIINMDVLEFSPQTKQELMDKHRLCYFKFLKAPKEIAGKERVEKIILEHNRLEGEAFSQHTVGTGGLTEIECGLVFRSIGYHDVAIHGVPFDEKQGIIPNQNGQVLGSDGSAISDMYTSGWIKRGPSGVIGINIRDSVETVNCLLNNMEQLGDREISADNNDCPKDIRAVSFEDWKKIDTIEIKRDKEKGKPREKFTTVAEMLEVI